MSDRTCKNCGWWAECDSRCEGYCDSGSSLWGGHLTTPAMTCECWTPPVDEMIITTADRAAMMPHIPLIYIAGPYAASALRSREAHIRSARAAAEMVLAAGGYPVTPHLLTGGMEDVPNMPARTDEYYYTATLTLMTRCDAVLMLPGWCDSRGATAEHAEAQRLGLPVYDLEQSGQHGLAAWMEDVANAS